MKGVDILYAAGINGNVPFTKSDSALLSDGDLASLDELKIIVEPKIKIVNNIKDVSSIGIHLDTIVTLIHLLFLMSSAF